MVQFARHVCRNHVAAILVIAFGVSFVAHADETTASPAVSPPPPPAQSVQPAQSRPQPQAVTVTETLPKPKAFRGSTISYGHSITAMTAYGRGETFNADPSGDPTKAQVSAYDPTWSHAITLAPEWHFNDLFFARGRMFISQELTPSGNAEGLGTTTKNEVELSDLFLDAATTGYTETKVTGLKVSGDVRFVLPTSKLSQAKTQWLTVGPGVALSRKFGLLQGLTIGYAARGTIRFNQYTSGHKRTNTLAPCLDANSGLQCLEDANMGNRNGFFDFAHGPLLSFQPFDGVSIDATMTWQRVWLYPAATLPTEFQDTLAATQLDSRVRDLTRFVLSASWQFSKPVGVSLTALTLGNQLNDEGHYVFPLFNRSTVLFLDLSLDVEAVASKLF